MRYRVCSLGMPARAGASVTGVTTKPSSHAVDSYRISSAASAAAISTLASLRARAEVSGQSGHKPPTATLDTTRPSANCMPWMVTVMSWPSLALSTSPFAPVEYSCPAVPAGDRRSAGRRLQIRMTGHGRFFPGMSLVAPNGTGGQREPTSEHCCATTQSACIRQTYRTWPDRERPAPINRDTRPRRHRRCTSPIARSPRSSSCTTDW